MSGGVLPGWYPDPAAPETQRYWDGEQWLGAPLPVDAEPPATPPAAAPTQPTQPALPTTPTQPGLPTTPGTPPTTPGAPASPEVWAAPGTPSSPPGPGRESVPLEQYPRLPQFPPQPPGQPPVGQPPTDPTLGATPPGPSGATPPWPPGATPPAPSATPSQAFPAGTLAPLGARLAARLVDIVVVLLLNIVVNGYFFIEYYKEVEPIISAWSQAVVTGNSPPALTFSDKANRLNLAISLVALGLWFAYEVPSTANNGQTLGKRLMRIRVARIDASTLTFWQSIWRWLVISLPSLLLGGCGLPIQIADALWCTWDRPARQCLHDKMAQTVVIQAAPPQPTGPH